ncbi:MAG: two-component regulator propeller domain-containing protein [Rhodothermales bacterium]
MRGPSVRYLLLLGTIVWAVGVPRTAAQPTPEWTTRTLDPAKAPTQYVFDRWTVEDGLPQSVVADMIQTADGHVWFGTDEGLARFDGVAFTVFDSGTNPTIRDNTMLALAADPEGGLWAGTRDGGLVHLDTDDRATAYGPGDGLASETVGALAVDGTGRLWLGTREGLCWHDVAPDSASPITCHRGADALAGAYIRALAPRRAGGVWVGTREGLYHFDGRRTHPYAKLGGAAASAITALHEDSAGGVWVGAWDGIGYLVGGRLTTPPGADAFDGAEVSALYADFKGSLWVGTIGSGVSRLHDGRVTPLPSDDGVLDNVRVLRQDREGSLWIGTDGRGLARVRDAKVTPFTTREGLGHDVVFSVTETSDGAVWVGTEGGGVSRIRNGRVEQTLTAADGLADDHVSTVYGTRDGALWIGTDGAGLSRYHKGVFTTYTTADGLPDQYVLALFEDRGGTLWVGTDGGLSRWDGRRFETLVTDGAPEGAVIALAQSADGALWVGTYGSGLLRYRDGVFAAPFADALHDVVLTLHARPDGSLWAGTDGGGIARIVGDDLVAFTTSEGLPTDAVFQILEDDEGYLWMSSNKGLFRIALAEFDAVARGRQRAVRPDRYGRADGMKHPECNGGVQPAGWRTHDGALWFATAQGAVTVDPAHLRSNRLPPPVAVQRVLVNGVPVSLGGTMAEGLSLPAGSDEFAFEYAGLSFFAPGQVRHRFRLEGRDRKWTEAGTRRTAYYTDLAPGTYRFRVQAANNDGVWNETGAVVTLTLAPHVWQTTWFAALCVLLMGAAGFGVYRVRVRQLRARAEHLEHVVEVRTHELAQEKATVEQQASELIRLDEAKTHFFNNISHEFRTPLTLTIGPLENALDGAYGPTPEPLRKQHEVMLRNARRLLRLINQLLDVAKLESGRMELEAQRGDLRSPLDMIVGSFQTFAAEHGIGLTLDVPDRPVALCYDPDKLEKVFYNLLSNAVKYTPADGTICVTVEEEVPSDGFAEGAVAVHVVDTGQGIPPEALATVFDRFTQVAGTGSALQSSTGIGLSLVRELVTLHGGEVSVESEIGVGTAFTVRLPLGEAHLSPGDLVGNVDAAARPSVLGGPEMIAMKREAAVEAPVSTVPSEAPRLLIVEDNPDVRGYIRDCLSDRYYIEEAPDGLAGLERARELRPDLILSDVMMPRMDGYTLCRTLKADPELQSIPLVLLTAKADDDHRVEGLELGADDFIAKPFNARELRARVHNLLTIKKQERELAELNADLHEKVREQLAEIVRGSRLRKYFPSKLVDAILHADEDVRLAAERKRVTVFFSDLTGFTHLSDTTPPEVVTELLNEYLGEMLGLIEAHGGTLDKFMGDGIMALFGAAEAMAPEEQARRAVEMAVAMQDRLRALRAKWKRDGVAHDLELRIGVHQDEVTVGNFGSDDLMEYTAIGQGVNLASRLEGVCTPGQILVSFPVYALTKEAFPYEHAEACQLRGIARPVATFSLEPSHVAAWLDSVEAVSVEREG